MANLKFGWTRVNNDIYGNPRYAIHFLNLLTDKERKEGTLSGKYALACKRANKIGGRKYHTKSYGGGIVFQSYNLEHEEAAILHELQKAVEEENN